MRHCFALVLALLLLFPIKRPARAQESAGPTSPSSTVVLPSGTQLALAVIRPVWSAAAKPGDPVYAQTIFPVTAGSQMAIPSGSYVAGQIDAITRPTKKSNHASLTVHFTIIILADGYTIPLPAAGGASVAQAVLDIQVTPANDLILDNGAQIELTLASPLTLDASRVAQAIPLTKPLQPGHFLSATKCRPTPATAGSADTVFPGTPGTPGTPDTVIPGIDGGPPSIIPGIPATPGTPATVIPGSPGYPGSYCPAPPLVLSSSSPNTQAKRI
jgi:hypothetical protein